jgi:hypothetical protein
MFAFIGRFLSLCITNKNSVSPKFTASEKKPNSVPLESGTGALRRYDSDPPVIAEMAASGRVSAASTHLNFPAATTMVQRVRSNAWTSEEEVESLRGYVNCPCEQQAARIVLPLLIEVTTNFLERFPNCRAEVAREKWEQVCSNFLPSFLTHLSPQKIRTWFGNHTRNMVGGHDVRRVLDPPAGPRPGPSA